jgi:dynein heavy chain
MKINNLIFFLQNLETNIELTIVKIDRAEKLISGLGGEKERWTKVWFL